MQELLKILTPQNFAMVIAIYLLVRFEKAILSLEDTIENLDRNITRSIEKNSKLLAVLLFNHRRESSQCNKAFKEVIESEPKG